MVDIKLDLNAEAIQAQIVKAIAEGVVGKEIEKAVNDLMGKQNSWSESLVQKCVKSVIEQMIVNQTREIMDQYKDGIREKIAARMTDDFIIAAIDKMFDAWLSNK